MLCVVAHFYSVKSYKGNTTNNASNKSSTQRSQFQSPHRNKNTTGSIAMLTTNNIETWLSVTYVHMLYN